MKVDFEKLRNEIKGMGESELIQKIVSDKKRMKDMDKTELTMFWMKLREQTRRDVNNLRSDADIIDDLLGLTDKLTMPY